MKGEEKQTDPIPVVKKKLPHDHIFTELAGGSVVEWLGR